MSKLDEDFVIIQEIIVNFFVYGLIKILHKRLCKILLNIIDK